MKKAFLYTFSVILLVCGGTYFWFTSKKEDQKKAIAWIEEKGGHTNSSINPIADKIPKSLKFLEKLLGKKVTSLSLRNRGVEYIYPDDQNPLEFPAIYPDRVVFEPVTDISILEKFPSLVSLSLDNTSVKDIFCSKETEKFRMVKAFKD